MNKRKILLTLTTIMMLLAGVNTCIAQEPADAKLGVDVDVTWVSKYLWRGYDLLDDKAAFQPSVNVDLYGTGFSINVWASYPTSAGFSSTLGASRVNATEYDYTVAYDTTLFEGESCATDVTANYIYYDFIDAPSTYADAQELGVGLAWPSICPGGIVPSYYVGKIWESKSKSTLTGEYGGWIHIFGLGYDLSLPGFLPDTPEQVFSLIADITYNDGFGLATADHDWSHATFGVSTEVALGEMTFTPAVYYQSSFDDSVNTEDELWVGLSLTYSF